MKFLHDMEIGKRIQYSLAEAVIALVC